MLQVRYVFGPQIQTRKDYCKLILAAQCWKDDARRQLLQPLTLVSSSQWVTESASNCQSAFRGSFCRLYAAHSENLQILIVITVASSTTLERY